MKKNLSAYLLTCSVVLASESFALSSGNFAVTTESLPTLDEISPTIEEWFEAKNLSPFFLERLLNFHGVDTRVNFKRLLTTHTSIFSLHEKQNLCV